MMNSLELALPTAVSETHVDTWTSSLKAEEELPGLFTMETFTSPLIHFSVTDFSVPASVQVFKDRILLLKNSFV